MPRKAKNKPRSSWEYDLDNETLVFKQGDEQVTFAFNGMRYDVFMKLAMIGARSILSKHDNKLLQWEKIKQNLFGRVRDYKRVPQVVKAYAKINNLPIEKAIKEYNAMSKDDKKAVKEDREIKKELLLMQIENL